jgi:hypothetical protein
LSAAPGNGGPVAQHAAAIASSPGASLGAFGSGSTSARVSNSAVTVRGGAISTIRVALRTSREETLPIRSRLKKLIRWPT